MVFESGPHEAALRIADPGVDEGREDVQAIFERVYDSGFTQVYAYVRYRVGSPDTAEDLTSQTYLQALDRLSTFKPGKGEIIQWIMGIARNVVRDHLRARRRWRWLPMEWLAGRTSPGPDPEQGAIGSEQDQRLLDAIRGLTDRERDVLGLKFGAGLTNQAIASLTGLTNSHVGVIVYRAVGRLRARLGAGEVTRA